MAKKHQYYGPQDGDNPTVKDGRLVRAIVMVSSLIGTIVGACYALFYWINGETLLSQAYLTVFFFAFCSFIQTLSVYVPIEEKMSTGRKPGRSGKKIKRKAVK